MFIKEINNYGIIIGDIEGAFTLVKQSADKPENKPERKPTEVRNVHFRDIVQYPDVDKLMARLHQLIDGKGGAIVGSTLLRCKQLNYVIDIPTQAQFIDEFELRGSWSAIYKYMDDNNLNALDKANRITIFD